MRQLVEATPVLIGRGLHGGREARLRVLPLAPQGSGVWFVRRDQAGARLPAVLEHAVPAARRLLLERDGLRVSTAEHLLAALSGLGIGDAEVELWGEEVPILDGSARPFADALWAASVAAPDLPSRPWQAARAFGLRRGSASCRLSGSDTLQIDARLDFGDASPLPRQRLSWRADDLWSFLHRLAPARTFGLLTDAAALQARGLARGAGLRALLVYGPHGLLNPEGTRFFDEPVRHNVLDALGVLALLGAPLCGRLLLERCGHALLVATLRAAIAEGALRRAE
jgi:UDP-3-O-[3-hydroxymyristoyl] N-acetylglucosamine deacetylase